MNIEELSSQLEFCTEQIANLQDKVQEQERIIREHQHTGKDDSFRITDADIVLKDGHAILSGPGGFVGDNGLIDTGVRRLHIACGPTGISEGTLGQESKNMQLTFEHQDYQGGLNFIYGLSNAVSNTCSITVSSTQTTFTDTATDFGADDSRVGQYLFVKREKLSVSGYTGYGYVITANTKHSLTISSAFGFDGKITFFLVYKPVYFGSSITQFKKIYTLDGLRFGPGASYNGQNGLLYMDTDGSLKYREPDGDVVSVGSGGALGDISDVNLTSPSDKQVLLYDNASSKWINGLSPATGITASDTLQASADTERSQYGTDSGWVKHKELLSRIGGTARIKFDLKGDGSGSAYGQIYINGIATGTEQHTSSTTYVTFSEDLNIAPGDRIQLYLIGGNSYSTTYCRNFRIYGTLGTLTDYFGINLN